MDLFGELCRAAHEDGIVVFARMDSNRAHEEFHRAHPDWFAVNAAGKPYKAGDLYVAPIYLDDTPGLSLRDLRTRSRRLKMKVPDLSLIVIDYIQLMEERNAESLLVVEDGRLAARYALTTTPGVGFRGRRRKTDSR
jgi:hypothetical protein